MDDVIHQLFPQSLVYAEQFEVVVVVVAVVVPPHTQT